MVKTVNHLVSQICKLTRLLLLNLSLVGSETRLAGKLMFFSGRTGEVLSCSLVPDNKESYYSPVIYNRNDGTPVVLFGTGMYLIYNDVSRAWYCGFPVHFKEMPHSMNSCAALCPQ